MKLQQWEALKKDAEYIMNSVPGKSKQGVHGRFFLGRAETELKNYENAIQHLKEGEREYTHKKFIILLNGLSSKLKILLHFDHKFRQKTY